MCSCAALVLFAVAGASACKKEILENYLVNDGSIAFTCKETAFNTRATAENDSIQSNKEVIMLSESDSLCFVVEKEMLGSNVEDVDTKGTFNNSLTEKIGLLVCNYENPSDFANATPQVAYKHPISAIGGG